MFDSYFYEGDKSLFSETFSAVSSPVQFAGVKAFKMSNKLQNYIEKQSEILNGDSIFFCKNQTEKVINITCPRTICPTNQ